MEDIGNMPRGLTTILPSLLRGRQFAVLLILLVALASGSICPVRAQEPAVNPQDNGGAGLSTGLITIAGGQTARISVVNVGGKDITGEMIFVPVSEYGKGLASILCNLIVSSGDGWSFDFANPTSAKTIQFYAQIRLRQNVDNLEKLVPSLQILDSKTGRMEQVLSGSDFVSFRPIFNPPS